MYELGMLGELVDRAVARFASLRVQLWRSCGWSPQMLTISPGCGRSYVSFAIRHGVQHKLSTQQPPPQAFYQHQLEHCLNMRPIIESSWFAAHANVGNNSQHTHTHTQMSRNSHAPRGGGTPPPHPTPPHPTPPHPTPHVNLDQANGFL